MLVSGEAGIGETRLTQELRRRRRRQSRERTLGARLPGRDVASVPAVGTNRPLVCRALQRHDASSRPRPAAGRLSLIVPQVGEGLRIPTAPEIETNRFQLSNAVHTFLQRASLQAPVLCSSSRIFIGLILAAMLGTDEVADTVDAVEREPASLQGSCSARPETAVFVPNPSGRNANFI